MAPITPLKTAPHTRIENTIIDERAAEMGPFGFTIYVITKRHLNQLTGHCYPSYATIARKSGMDRSTVIRYVKKLKAMHMLSPSLRFKEDGSPTSNQYNFQGTENPVLSKEPAEPVQIVQGGGTEPPPLVAENHHPSGTQPPEQSEANKKEKTIPDDHSCKVRNMDDTTRLEAHINLYESPIVPLSPPPPTKKQRTCPHPPTELVFIPDNITICHHCYGLLDENLKLKVVEEVKTPEIEAA